MNDEALRAFKAAAKAPYCVLCGDLKTKRLRCDACATANDTTRHALRILVRWFIHSTAHPPTTEDINYLIMYLHPQGRLR